MIKSRVNVVSQIDLIKYMLNRPLITRRIGKWSLAFSEFTLVYFPHKSVKGQALTDFLVDFPSLEAGTEQSVELGIYVAEKEPWILKFDGSSTKNLAGARIVIISPREVKTTLSFNLAFVDIVGLQDFQKKLYRRKSFFSVLWTRCSTPNESSHAFSKSFQAKWPYSLRVQRDHDDGTRINR